jgi:hypothetical protein
MIATSTWMIPSIMFLISLNAQKPIFARPGFPKEQLFLVLFCRRIPIGYLDRSLPSCLPSLLMSSASAQTTVATMRTSLYCVPLRNQPKNESSSPCDANPESVPGRLRPLRQLCLILTTLQSTCQHLTQPVMSSPSHSRRQIHRPHLHREKIWRGLSPRNWNPVPRDQRRQKRNEK